MRRRYIKHVQGGSFLICDPVVAAGKRPEKGPLVAGHWDHAEAVNETIREVFDRRFVSLITKRRCLMIAW